MSFLLFLSKAIDALNERVGAFVKWLILVAVIVCTANAIMRYAFNYSSNGFLEVQWYLYGAVFMLYGGLALRRNQHVRIDLIAGRFSPRGQAWLDLLGGLIFLLPVVLLMLYDSWGMAALAIVSGEMSSDPGGLIRWPAKILIPIGFLLLALQGFSEVIKRAAFLMGLIDDPTPRSNPLDDVTDLQEAVKEIAAEKR
ncbi:MAG TPA: TRAP transporter small permease subunit [Burkholderiaceae bacterium]|nr:TRAP transporter small permease subunit [Burkholderiaceae bacterium]